MLRASADTVHRARRLRKDLSPAELRLWLVLRDRPGDLKFRKQHPIGTLSLDFYCAAARLCIEVDGEAHDRGDQPEFDASREAWLNRHDVETLRIPAVEVFRNLDGVVSLIVEAARLRPPLHRPSGGPPPRSGEVKEHE
jgi:very-short-patch-repair endonuclease